ncbi:MAG: Holliday junction branch migration protein RuvA [bacterium]|nr:Holliday junction branch migration protein RuvA [bacterium]
MIDWICGKICLKEPTRLVIEAGMVAFDINIPLSTYEALENVGDKTKVFVILSLKNEKLELFGFKTIEERNFFNDLLLVQGIGPQNALRIMSSVDFTEFKSMVLKEDTEFISSIKGIGEKRANKLIFELRDRYKKEEIPESFESSAIHALTVLGIPAKKAREAIKGIKTDNLEELIKEALKKL